MRNVWIFISGLVVVAAIGGAVYYVFSQQPANLAMPDASVPQMPMADTQVLVVPAGNPLLTADREQFDRWVPLYPIRCGEILFEKVDTKAQHFAFCIGEIKRRVARATEKQLSREDVLDPGVKAHWHEVMGGK